ncbi:MAG: murein biosynthesis integral membrane protein MurJ, partial [Acidimicrobiales bacterium]
MTGPGIESGPEGAIAAPPSTRGMARATLGMAIGTTLSRITGVGRLIALAIALGQIGAADAYNLANTTPNIIHDIVIGGVLA